MDSGKIGAFIATPSGYYNVKTGYSAFNVSTSRFRKLIVLQSTEIQNVET